ncbi:hypothetical protein ACHAXA_005356 [Cyclostephanos tholiformis]
MHIGLDEDEANAYVSSLKEEDVRRRVNAATVTAGGDAGGSEMPSSAAVDESSSRQRALLSQRPNLERKMREYLLPYTRDFNELLAKRGYAWRLNET